MELFDKADEIWCRFKSPRGWQERFVCRQEEFDSWRDENARNVWFLAKLETLETEDASVYPISL